MSRLCGAFVLRCPGCENAVASNLTACPRCGVAEPFEQSTCRNRVAGEGVRCFFHGGSAPQSKSAAERRRAEGEALRVLAGEFASSTPEPVSNPLEALAELAGEVVSWKNLLKDHLAVLGEWRYETGQGEALRAEIGLFERALDRAARLLVDVGKLNLDDRLVSIYAKANEQQGRTLAGMMQRALAQEPLEVRERVGARLAQELRSLDAERPAIEAVAVPRAAEGLS